VLEIRVSKLTHKEWRIQVKGTFAVTFTVEPAPLRLPATIDLGTVGVALAAGDAIPVTGGTPPYTITNVTGTVPPGVTINSDGTLAGTPQAAGSFPLEIALQDVNG
jgi:large repetitive protein